jgi:general secretion pathway protein K
MTAFVWPGSVYTRSAALLGGRRRRGYRSRGYVLPLTLAVLVMLTIIGTVVGNIANASIEQAMSAKRRADAEYALASAQSQLLNMLAILPRTTRGIGGGAAPIRPDGRPYALNASIIVRMQDLRGLVPLNPSLDSEAGNQRIGALIKSYGVSDQQTGRLVDTLQDYRDADELQRLNGAEGPNVPFSIRNQDLQDPAEIYRINAWRQAAAAWEQDPIERYVDTHRQQAFNPNFAPARVIAAIARVRLEDAQTMVKERLLNPDLDLSPVLFNSIGDPFGSAGFVLRQVGPGLRVTLQHRENPWAYEFVVQHTPEEVQTPWRISRFRRVSVPPLGEKEPIPPTLPSLSELKPMIAPRVELRF